MLLVVFVPLSTRQLRRAASVTAETGFHSASIRSGPGRFSAGTNVFATNVSGKITTNAVLFSTSGFGTSSPRYAITQDSAYANASSSRNPPRASSTEDRTRHPTASPARDITTTVRTL